MDLAYNQYLTEYYTQIGITWRLSWKERAKDVYSQVAMHQKNELVSAANE